MVLSTKFQKDTKLTNELDLTSAKNNLVCFKKLEGAVSL